MAKLSSLHVGSGSGAQLVVQGNGVAPLHAVISWQNGLLIKDLGAGRTTVDGRVLAPNEAVALSGFRAEVYLGDARLSLAAPELAALFVERTALAVERPGVGIVGRDPSSSTILVDHSTVSRAHARIDVSAGTITDLGSSGGTFDRNTQRLTPNQPAPLDVHGGYWFGSAWVPTSVVLSALASPPGSVGMGAAGATAHGAPPEGPMSFAPSSVSSAVLSTGALQAAASVGQLAAPPQSVRAPGVQRTMFGQFNFDTGAGAARAIIGRLPNCDIVLPFPQVSSRHTSITRAPDGSLILCDLGSTNGTYVNGHRLAPGHNVTVPPKTKIFVGPYALIVDLIDGAVCAYAEHHAGQGNQNWTGNLVEVEALELFLNVADRDNQGRDKTLLNRVTFKALPGDLIALMGPSGAGKTTLLTVLNGYLRPTSGEVRINGENLYAVYDALRGSIGYVPQDDILHAELTVREAIAYSARFRLPPDFSEEEIQRRVDQTIKDLNLDGVQNSIIGKPEKKVLSGGQRKRVNIALELVTDPALMFLDEPTSGLAADDTVQLIDLLSTLATKYGKTIIVTIHQPAREEYEKFNLAFIMGYGGEPVYFGPTGPKSYDFFGRYVAGRGDKIDNPRDMFDLLKRREDDMLKLPQLAGQPKPAVRLLAAQEWRKEFYQDQNPVYREMYSGNRQPGTPGQNRPPTKVSVPLLRQLRLLFVRYAIVKMRDRVGTAILFLQAPIIGLLLATVFSDPPKMVNFWCQAKVAEAEAAAAKASLEVARACQALPDKRFPEVQDFSGALFFLAVASIWFGTSNAAREIVAEQAIYRRERMVNLSIVNYVLSKFGLLALLCVIQCTVLLAIAYPAVGLGHDSFASFPIMLGMMITTSTCAVGIGLLLSTVVTSSEAAMALTPIALIPQVVLGGLLVPMTNKSWLPTAMAAMPARWSFEGLMGAERAATADSWRIETCAAKTDHGFLKSGGKHYFDCAIEQIARSSENSGGWGFEWQDVPAVQLGVLGGMTLLMLVTVAVLLRRRDSV